MQAGEESQAQPTGISRLSLVLLAGICAGACAFAVVVDLAVDFLTQMERITCPVGTAGFLLIAGLFLVVREDWLPNVSHVFKVAAGLLLLSGLVEGLIRDDSNLAFYIAWLPVFYAAVFFTSDTRTALRWNLIFFGVCATVVLGLALAGPLPWTHLHVLLLGASLFAQLAVILLFHFIARSREVFAVAAARADVLELAATQLREQAEAAQRAQQRAEAADRTKSVFLATVSHELRTPLNAIIGFSEVMEMQMLGTLSAEYRGYAQNINGSGQHLLNIIDDILDITRVEQGELRLGEEWVDLAALFENCRALLDGQAAKDRVTIDWASLCEPLQLWADRQRLSQVVINLIGNAIKFNRPGGRVTVTAMRDEAGDLAICIADTGIGMKETDTVIALDPFRQLDEGHTRRHDGVGLGLPITRSLVELHGGTLQLDSRVDSGTVATVTLPRRRIAGPIGSPMADGLQNQAPRAG